MCRQKIICYAACGHEEYEGEPVLCSDFEKFLKTLSWNFVARNKKGLQHCVKIVYDRHTNPSPCHVCNAQAFRQQRALAPDTRKKGIDQSSIANAGPATNKSQVHGPRSGNPDQRVQPAANAESTTDYRFDTSARKSESREEEDREAWRRYLQEKDRKEQAVFPLQASALGRRGAIRRTPSTEKLRRIRRDSQADSPSYLTTPSQPVGQESHRRSLRNSQQFSSSYSPNTSSLDAASARPLKPSEQGRASHAPAADEQWRRYYEALGKGPVVPRPQQGAGPVLNAPINNEPGNRRSGILLNPDRQSTGSKHIKWADEVQNNVASSPPRKGWAQQLVTPPKEPSKPTPMLPEPLRVKKTSPMLEGETPSRRRSRFLEDINCVDLGY
ncbi:hypothetical protein DL546_002479 [Coniochaeta pulveracea]|uniref:Uncharacterized protein n=1 Tax=Coniochaeta pulveracea TaxID=177199 RepID=A0A420XX10_9PEZI|nr:hypothetical protein DL546_002479 [Coniochaeta pulveracea]